MRPDLPPTIADLIAPAWVWLISMLGAGVSYLEDFKLEDTWKAWLLKGATKFSSSALAAVLTFHLLKAMDVSAEWSVVLVGISGHMGIEALKAMGELWKSRIGAPPTK